MNISIYIREAEKIVVALESDNLSRRESSLVEFKETYKSGMYERFAKSLAAFANNKGGMIIFGIKDTPRSPVGLSEESIFREVKFRNIANNHFYPELEWEFQEKQINGKRFGVLCINEADHKPVIAIKNWANEVSDGVIYYRYRGENLAIRSSNLIKLLENRLSKELTSFSSQINLIAKAKPSNTAIMDFNKGKISGDGGNLYIDNKLLDKVKFIKRGRFVEGGAPALRVVGDVHPVSARLSDDEGATPIKIDESNFMKYTPLTYEDAMSQLGESVQGFSRTREFIKLFKELKESQEGKTTYLRRLNPSNKSEIGKWWYSIQFVQMVITEVNQRELFREGKQ